MPEILLNKKHTVGRPYFVGGFRTGNRAIIDHLNSQTSKTKWMEDWVAMAVDLEQRFGIRPNDVLILIANNNQQVTQTKTKE